MDEGAAGASMDLLGLLTSASVETMAVLVVCGLFSLISWYVIFAKWREFRRLRSERTAFEAAVAGRTSLEAREQVVAALGRSPFADVVRTVSGFLADLRGANERGGVSRTGLSLTQLEALTLALDTQVRAEAERASRRIPWLATIASTAPLLGLFGTVLGIMQSFTGIASGSGSSNIAAVAPGDKTAPPPEPPYQGLDHIGLRVIDLDATVSELKSKGARFTMEPTTIRPGVRIAFMRGPENVSIELLQRDA